MESDSLNDSWIEVSFTGAGGVLGASMHASLEDTDLARLLKEAQDGSQQGSSRVGSGSTTSQASPPSPPLSREEPACGEGGGPLPTPHIVVDLSSRPEITGVQQIVLRHPYTRGYSLRNSDFIKGKSAWFLDNLPILIASHACSFLLGAATVAVVSKKYTNYAPAN